MAIETLAARTGATPLRIRRVQKITLTLLFIAGIVNFLDRSSLSVAGEAIRSPTASHNCRREYCWIALDRALCSAPD